MATIELSGLRKGTAKGYEKGIMDCTVHFVRFAKDINLNQLNRVGIKEKVLRSPVLIDCREAESVPTDAQDEHS